MKRLTLWVLVLPLLAAAWVLGTESGLRTAVVIAQALTGQQLQLRGASGRLVGVVGFDEVVYTHPSSTVELRDVRLDLRLSRLLISRIQAEVLSASLLVVTTHETPPDPDPEALTVTMPLRLAVEHGEIRRFELRLDDGARNWGVSDLEFAARWRDQWIVIGNLVAVTAEAGAVAVRGRVAMVDDQLLIEDLEAEGPGTARVTGALALSDAAENALEVEWQDLRWPNLEEATSRSGRARLQGPWDDYQWEVAAQVEGLDLAGDVSAGGRGTLERLDFQRFRLKSLGGEVRGAGRISWADALAVSATLALDRLNPGARFDGWDGTVSGTASVVATWAGSVPALDFQASLRDSRLRGYPLNLQLRGSSARRRVVLDELVANSGPSQLRGRGRLLPDLDLAVELESPDLRSLWAGLSGSASASLQLKGPPEALQVMVNANGSDLAFAPVSGAPLRAGRAHVSGSLAQTARSEFRVELQDADLGLRLRQLQLSGDGTRARHQLRVEADGEAGAASLQLDGGYSGRTWRGSLRHSRLAPVGEAPWLQDEAAEVVLAWPRWSVGQLCLLRVSARACAEASTGAGGTQAAVSLAGFELASLRYWMPAEWVLAGSIEGSVAARWRDAGVEELNVDLENTAGSLVGSGVKLEFGPGTLQVEPKDQRLQARLRLRPAGGEIEGEVFLAPGTLLVDRPLSGELRARLPDLSWLPVLSLEIASASGAVDSQLSLSGTLRSPALAGRVVVDGARVQLATPGIELTDISAMFESRPAMPLSLSIRAQSGGGSLQLDGGLERLRPSIEGKFTLTGEAAQWINTPEIRAWVTPQLDLTLAGANSRLTGEILVARAAITPRGLSSGGVGPSADQVLVESDRVPSGRSVQVESQVRIVLGSDVRFDGLGLKTRLEGGIAANDGPGRPTRGSGELRLVGGRYKAYGQDLTIETGRLLFSGGPVTEPGIELSAFRQPIEGVRVGLRARGPLATPSFSLYSDPAMSQEEQLSWLVLGRPLNETLQSGQRTEIDSAAASLGFAGGEYLAQQLAPKVGLDEVTVGSRPGETAEQARLTIGKYLSPRLFVSYGFGLFQPTSYVRLQYDLGGGFKLSGESGLEQGGDLVYTFER